MIELQTTAGLHWLCYRDVVQAPPSSSKLIDYSLGTETASGQWNTIARDLQADFQAERPGESILKVNAFLVRGSGRLDSISLLSELPPADSDRDGISDDLEEDLYLTDSDLIDSDGDGISDGEELIYWRGEWNVDFDDDPRKISCQVLCRHNSSINYLIFQS